MFSIVVTTDLNLGIGKSNSLPWRIKKDMNYFKEITTHPYPETVLNNYQMSDIITGLDITQINLDENTVIMGRKTWDSIPPKFRPLDKRKNIIVSRNMENNIENVNIYSDLNSAISHKNYPLGGGNTYVIGGAEIYRQAIEHPHCDKIYQTVINKVFDCDTFFPDPVKNFQEIASSAIYEENGLEFQFKVLGRR